MKSAITPLTSITLGTITGFAYRDELFLPTHMRLKMSLIEYHLLTRQKMNMDILDVIEP